MEITFHVQGSMGWNGTIKAEFVKITYDEKKKIIHTHMHMKTHSYTCIHTYTPTHILKKVKLKMNFMWQGYMGWNGTINDRL